VDVTTVAQSITALRRLIRRVGLSAKYAQLVKGITSPGAVPAAAWTDVREANEKIAEGIGRLDATQRRLLDDSLELDMIGNRANERLVRARASSGSPAGRTEVISLSEEAKKLVGYLGRAVSVLDPFVKLETEAVVVPEDCGTVSIVYPSEAEANTLIDLENVVRLWVRHFRAISRLTRTSADDVVTRKLTRGSLAIEVIAAAAVVVAVGEAVVAAMNVVEKTSKLRKIEREIRNLDLQNEELEASVRRQREETEEREMIAAAEELVESTEVPSTEDNETEEIEAGIRSVITSVVELVQRGIRIEIGAATGKATDQLRLQITEGYRAIEELDAADASALHIEGEDTNG